MLRLARVFSLVLLASLCLMPGVARATTYTFTGADQTFPKSWFSAENWIPSGVPGASDTAVISIGTPGAITVQFSGSVTVSGLDISNPDATLDGFDDVTRTRGTINVTGDFNWSGGTLQDMICNVASGASFNVSGNTDKTIGGYAILNNSGRGVWTGTGNLVLFEQAFGDAFNNHGTFDIRNDATIANPRSNFGPAVVTNSGNWTKSAGHGITHFGHLRFTNSGSINVNSGTLEMQGLVTNSGPITVAAGCFVNLAGPTNSGTYRFNTGTTFAGAGRVRVFDSANTTDGTTAIDASGVINLTGTLDFIGTGTDSGAINIRTTGTTLTLNGTGTFNWTGGKFVLGTLIVGSGVRWNISGPAAKSVQSTDFVNNGTATWTGTGNIYPLGSTFTNDGTFNVQTDADIGGFNAALTFVNAGTFTKSGTTGLTALGLGQDSIPFSNRGTVNVNSGTLQLGRGGGTWSGPFNVASNAVLQVTGDANGREFVLGSGTRFDGNGRVRIGFPDGDVLMRGGAVVNCLLEIDGRLNAQGSSTALTLGGSGPINWVDGEINGVLNLANGTRLNIVGNSTNRVLRGIINSAGNATWNGGPVTFYGTFNNTGTFSVQSDQEWGGVFSDGVFNNRGTFLKEVSRGTTSIGGTSGTVAFNNNGTINIKSGVLNFRNRFTQTAGSTLLSGGGLAGANPLLVQGGMLGGNGTIAGAVVLSGGQLNPGLTVAGVLRETGDYTQSGSGTLVVQLNGLTFGTQYDRLTVSGAVHLGGSLRVSAGFKPAVGTQFIIIANDSTDAVTGTFSGLPQGATITTLNGVRFHITYKGGDGNDVVLSSF